MARDTGDGPPNPEEVRRQLDALGKKMKDQGVASHDLRQMETLYGSYLRARTVEPQSNVIVSLRRWLFGE